ncbi:hypothetical protein [Saccharothrix sp. Mg75]|uniref:hypothetical protein n=1 Tax=Saccharothrix sp. Mg75 TaxID=3445357 RepID=UPI003EEB06C1
MVADSTAGRPPCCRSTPARSPVSASTAPGPNSSPSTSSTPSRTTTSAPRHSAGS